jgi:hypothetical protein
MSGCKVPNVNTNNSTALARKNLWALLLLKLYYLHIKMLFGMLPLKRGCFYRSCIIQWPEKSFSQTAFISGWTQLDWDWKETALCSAMSWQIYSILTAHMTIIQLQTFSMCNPHSKYTSFHALEHNGWTPLNANCAESTFKPLWQVVVKNNIRYMHFTWCTLHCKL